VEEAAEFYKTELEALGWASYFNMPADANGAVLVYNKDSTVLTITIAESSGAIVVILTMA
jgi:hypothetical protein